MNAAINYSCWKEEYKSFLEILSEKDIFFFYSGGKDSSLGLDFFAKAAEEFGFHFETHAVSFPVHRYPGAEKERVKSYWFKRGIEIIWHMLEDTDEALEVAENPCLPCQKIRKTLLKIFLIEAEQDLEKIVLVINFSLWDIVSYSIEHVLAGIFSRHEEVKVDERAKRFKETSQRFYPLLKMKEGYMVFRPLIKYNANDIVKMLEKEGIPILSIPCKYKDFRPKRILEHYYTKIGLRFDYDRVFDFAKKSFNLPDISSYSSIDKEEYLLRLF